MKVEEAINATKLRPHLLASERIRLYTYDRTSTRRTDNEQLFNAHGSLV